MKKYWCHSIIFMHFWQFDNKGLVQITSLKITVESENFCNACSNLSKWVVSYVCIQMFFQLAIFSKRLFTNQAFSWTALTCLFREPFSPNDWLQIKQANGLSFSWTVLTCVFKLCFLSNDLLQIKQLNGCSSLWKILTCVFRLIFCPNDLLQIKHWNFLISWWTNFTCRFKANWV